MPAGSTSSNVRSVNRTCQDGWTLVDGFFDVRVSSSHMTPYPVQIKLVPQAD